MYVPLKVELGVYVLGYLNNTITISAALSSIYSSTYYVCAIKKARIGKLKIVILRLLRGVVGVGGSYPSVSSLSGISLSMDRVGGRAFHYPWPITWKPFYEAALTTELNQPS